MITILEYLVNRHTTKDASEIDLDMLIDTVCKDKLVVDDIKGVIKYGQNLWVKIIDTGKYSKWFKVWAFFYTHPGSTVDDCQKTMNINDIEHMNWHGLIVDNVLERIDKNKYIGKDPKVWR